MFKNKTVVQMRSEYWINSWSVPTYINWSYVWWWNELCLYLHICKKKLQMWTAALKMAVVYNHMHDISPSGSFRVQICLFFFIRRGVNTASCFQDCPDSTYEEKKCWKHSDIWFWSGLYSQNLTSSVGKFQPVNDSYALWLSHYITFYTFKPILHSLNHLLQIVLEHRWELITLQQP